MFNLPAASKAVRRSSSWWHRDILALCILLYAVSLRFLQREASLGKRTPCLACVKVGVIYRLQALRLGHSACMHIHILSASRPVGVGRREGLISFSDGLRISYMAVSDLMKARHCLRMIQQLYDNRPYSSFLLRTDLCMSP
jgi:hypothetical protein